MTYWDRVPPFPETMHNCNPLYWRLRCTRVGRQWFSFHQYWFAHTPICGLTLQHFQPISTNCLPSASCNLVTSVVFPVAIVSPLTVYISTCLWISGDVKSALWTVSTLGRQQLVVSGSVVNVRQASGYGIGYERRMTNIWYGSEWFLTLGMCKLTYLLTTYHGRDGEENQENDER